MHFQTPVCAHLVKFGNRVTNPTQLSRSRSSLCAMAKGTAVKTDLVLLGLVPVGEENAVTARLLWQVSRVGAVATAKCKLNMMASEGIVRRKKIWRGPSEVTLYWKQSE